QSVWRYVITMRFAGFASICSASRLAIVVAPLLLVAVVAGCDRSISPGSPVVATSTSDDTPAPNVSAVAEVVLVDLDKVELGSDELVRGIPGEGPLTLDEIAAWLDREEVHQVIEPRLPIGLAAGEREITGIDD